MVKMFQILLVVVAVVSVAIGDVFIKKAAQHSTFLEAITDKWLLLGVLLYMVQIVLFTWMFVKGWNLSVVGSMQTVFYAAVVIGAGYFVFQERLNPAQVVGISLAFLGVIITNVFSS